MRGTGLDHNAITQAVLDAAFRIHTALGPGLLESAYETCLAFELAECGMKVARQVALPVVYRGVRLDAGYRLDLLVEDSVVVEVKAVEAVLPVHEAQLMSYLKLAGKPVGLLLNFHVTHMRDGITRRINRSVYPERNTNERPDTSQT